MINRPLLDTDVVIDYLRRRPEAVAFIRSLTIRPLISVVTVGELYSGVRDGSERSELDALATAFRVVPITREIAQTAGLLRRQFANSHGVQLADALIAATATTIDAHLFTLNVNHYPMIAVIQPAYRKSQESS